MKESNKPQKRDLHDEESDCKRVGKMQSKKKEKLTNVQQLPAMLRGEKPRVKKMHMSKRMATDAKLQKKRKSKGVNVVLSQNSQTTSDTGSNEKVRGKNKTKNKRKADEISRASVEDEDDRVYGGKGLKMAGTGVQIRTRKCKNSNKKKKMNLTCTNVNEAYSEKKNENEGEGDVYQISSGDEDFSKGMKKWITNYYDSRPGLDKLQKKIDDFMSAHEERLEQERQNREAKAAEGGWTVVVHHKGRKKTTEVESGTAVGSVSQAALEDKVAKKKQNEPVAHGFYRFQKREAQRSEILALQSKFEQDKKRIQQLRAARKFKPY